jgi:uncharacterized membrane protein
MAENKEIQEGKIFGVIGYLWILCLVPLLFKKENKFALFHGKQGLVLFLGDIAAGIIMMIPIIGLIGFLAFFIFAILRLIGIIQALLGNYWKIPVVGDIAEKFNI